MVTSQLLRETLEGMCVPPIRVSRLSLEDLHWLRRNLAIRNFGDPKLKRAMGLVVDCIRDFREDDNA